MSWSETVKNPSPSLGKVSQKDETKPIITMSTWTPDDMINCIKKERWNSIDFFTNALQLSLDEYKEQVQIIGLEIVNICPGKALPKAGQPGFQDRINHERSMFTQKPDVYQRLFNLPTAITPTWFHTAFFLAGRGNDHNEMLYRHYGPTILSLWQRHCAEKGRKMVRQDTSTHLENLERSSTPTNAKQVDKSSVVEVKTPASISVPVSKKRKLTAPVPEKTAIPDSIPRNVSMHSLHFGITTCKNDTLSIDIARLPCSCFCDQHGKVTDFQLVKKTIQDRETCPLELLDMPTMFYFNQDNHIISSRFREGDLNYVITRALRYSLKYETVSVVFIAKDKATIDRIPEDLLMLHLRDDCCVSRDLKKAAAEDNVDDDSLFYNPLRPSQGVRGNTTSFRAM